MTLFKQYTSYKCSIKTIKFVIYALFISLCLSACSTTKELKKTQSEVSEASALEQNEVETIAVDKVLNSEIKQAPLVPAKNLYVQQQIDKPIIVSEEVQKDYQQALTLMKAKKWQQAQTLFDKVILKQPSLSGSYVNKAMIAKQQGKLAAAQLLLNKAIEVNSVNLYAHHLQGQIYRLQGAFEKSEQSYLAALSIWPDFAQAHASMAILLELYRGRLLDAHAHYSTYLTLKPDDEEVKRWLAGLEIKIKRAGLEIPIKTQISLPQVDKTSSDEQSTDDKTLTAVKELSHDKS